MMNTDDIKEKLYTYCLRFVEQRISTTRDAMKEAQESGNEETKSSAGDKYETGRAMMHLENEKLARQLEEAYKLQRALHQLTRKAADCIGPGSLAMTNHGNFYMAISAGKVIINGVEYFAVSPGSPIGQKLAGLEKGASILFNGRTFVVEEIM